MTSPTSSTTQMRWSSRRGSSQIVHRGPSARLKHTSQRPMRSLTSRIASARAKASSGEARRTWKASRWAGRPPTPGSLDSSVTRRWIGAAYTRGPLALLPARGAVGRAARQSRTAGPAAGPAQAAQPTAQPEGPEGLHGVEARRVAHRLLAQVVGLAQRLVDGGQHDVLQQLHVLGGDRVGVDGQRLEPSLPRGDDLDHAATRRGLDLLVLELLLRGGHLLLELLGLLEHLVEVGRHGHQWWSSPSDSSWASNSSMKRAISSSSGRTAGPS